MPQDERLKLTLVESNLMESPEELDLNEPQPNESHILLEVLKASATEEDKRRAKEIWDKLPWWKKLDYQDEYELDML